MTPAETITILMNYNSWRRGEYDSFAQLEAYEIAMAIDSAIALICKNENISIDETRVRPSSLK